MYAIRSYYETGQILDAMGGRVDTRLYPGMGHTVNRDEIKFVQGMIDRLLLGE